MRKTLSLLCFLLAACASAGFGYELDVEGGLAGVGYNDVKIPGNTGTRFSLKEGFSVETKAFYRIRLTEEIGKDKFLSFLYAPLSFDASGRTAASVNFNNDSFPEGTDVSARYRFDSYRISYWKNYQKGRKLRLKLGFTGKVRDASISIAGGSIVSEKKNTGFVPLLNFGAVYGLNEKLKFIFDADALAGGPGRAEDVLLALEYGTGETTAFRIGYRFVEGGADTDEVYNFAMINYACAGFRISF